jgi:hypothetical protein
VSQLPQLPAPAPEDGDGRAEARRPDRPPEARSRVVRGAPAVRSAESARPRCGAAAPPVRGGWVIARDGAADARHPAHRAATAGTVAAWPVLAALVPVMPWAERPLPFEQIHRQLRLIGAVDATTPLLLVMGAAYLVLA